MGQGILHALLYTRKLESALASDAGRLEGAEEARAVEEFLAKAYIPAADDGANGGERGLAPDEPGDPQESDPVHTSDHGVCDDGADDRRWFVVRRCQPDEPERSHGHLQLLGVLRVCVQHPTVEG